MKSGQIFFFSPRHTLSLSLSVVGELARVKASTRPGVSRAALMNGSFLSDEQHLHAAAYLIGEMRGERRERQKKIIGVSLALNITVRLVSA